MSKRPKPRAGKNKTRKPLTSKKQILEANKDLLEQVQGIATNMQEHMRGIEERVAKSNQELWDNQQKQSLGLEGAQEHIMLLRRVLNDALSGVTRVETVKRPVEEKSPESEKAQVIDWGWYNDQLCYQDDKNAYMVGVSIPDDRLAELKTKSAQDRRDNIVKALAHKAIMKDEAEVAKAIEYVTEFRAAQLVETDEPQKTEDELAGLRELLNDHMPPTIQWEDSMDVTLVELTNMVLNSKRQRRAMGTLSKAVKDLIDEDEQSCREEVKEKDPSAEFVEAVKILVTDGDKRLDDWSDDLPVKAHMMLKAQISALDRIKQDKKEKAINDAIERLSSSMTKEALEEAAGRIVDGEPILKHKDLTPIEMDKTDCQAAYLVIKHILDEKVDPDENPELVEIEKQALMVEHKEMAELAGRTVKAIESGDEAGAQKGMAEMDQKVKEKEALADPHPELPAGAMVFGGDG